MENDGEMSLCCCRSASAVALDAGRRHRCCHSHVLLLLLLLLLCPTTTVTTVTTTCTAQWLEETKSERKHRNYVQSLIRKRNNEMHSIRSDTEHKLNIARRFRNDAIYYPHTLDFRGRAYPMHPHLNHMGNDLCRGLLTFSEGRPLGSRGWHWLLVHLYNLHDGGKRSMDDRAQWALEHMPQILATARDPLGEVDPDGRWWVSAESPFQCLAVCREIAEIVTTLRPEDYPTYRSRQPVYQVGVLVFATVFSRST